MFGVFVPWRLAAQHSCCKRLKTEFQLHRKRNKDLIEENDKFYCEYHAKHMDVSKTEMSSMLKHLAYAVVILNNIIFR